VWNDHQFIHEAKAQRRLVGKLKQLKMRVKSWLKEKRILEQISLGKIEEELDYHYKQKTKGVHSRDLDFHLKYLEVERNKHLFAEEERWRQKSRVIWIQSDDKNTKISHRFASHRGNNKHIWEIKDENGMVHTCQEALKGEASRFLNSLLLR